MALEDLVKLLSERFIHRSDTYLKQGAGGRYVRVAEPITAETLMKHLKGEETIAVYQINPNDNSVKWMCFDLDPEKLEDPKETVKKLWRKCKEVFNEKSILIEASRYPDPSFHLWIFFTVPIPALAARFLAKRILNGVKEANNIEVFPKQDFIGPGEFGNAVKLPLGLHKVEEKWSHFLDPETLEPVDSRRALQEIVGASFLEKELQRILEMAKKEQKWFNCEKTVEKYKGPNPPCIRNLLNGVSEGIRNESAIRLASYLLNFKGLNIEDAWRILKEWNKRNAPALPEKELKNVLESAAKGGYVYGCNDEILSRHCDKLRCPFKSFNGVPLENAEKEALQILNSENPIEELKKHLDNLVCGEDENKLTIFVLLLSGKFKDPSMKQMILLKGTEGAGKTTLMNIADAFKVKDVGRFTAHALDYTNLEGYEVLRLKEIGNMDEEKQGVSTIKFLSSDDKGYTVEFTIRDKETGQFTTSQYRIPPITIISSTTRVSLDPQYIRRNWIFNPDESPEQTKRVLKWKAKQEREKAEVALGLRPYTNQQFSKAVLRALISKLEPCNVVIPFPESLAEIFETKTLRVRGDYDKILTFIKLYCFLNQNRLPKIEVGNRKIILATPQLAIEALKIVLKPLITMMSNLEERTRSLIKVFKELGVEYEGQEITKEKRDLMAQKLGRSVRTIRRYLNEWENAGYLSGEGRPKIFRLIYNLTQIEEKIAGVSAKLESANDLLYKMQKEALEWLNSLLDKRTPLDDQLAEIRKSLEKASFTSNFNASTSHVQMSKSNSMSLKPFFSQKTLNHWPIQKRPMIREVIGKLHRGFKQDEKTITQRVVKAIHHPLVNILAHPSHPRGRLLEEPEAYAIDLDRVLNAARETGVWLEINSQPHRLDLPDCWAMKAKKRGVKIAINTDAHSKDSLDFIKLGVITARRGWLEKEDVINTLPSNEVLRLLRKKKAKEGYHAKKN